jgi:hypothetical protein
VKAGCIGVFGGAGFGVKGGVGASAGVSIGGKASAGGRPALAPLPAFAPAPRRAGASLNLAMPFQRRRQGARDQRRRVARRHRPRRLRIREPEGRVGATASPGAHSRGGLTWRW